MRNLCNLLSLFLLNALIASSVAAQVGPTLREKESTTFKISVPLEFKGRVVSGSLRRSDIRELLNLPVRNGDTSLKEGYGVEMTKPDGEKFMAYTCVDWKKAQAEEAYPATTYDMAMEGFLIHTCGLVFELQRATLPLKSFIANPHVGLANLNLLPGEILSAMPEEHAQEKERLRGTTVSEVVAPKNIEKAKDEIVTLSYGGFKQSFWEAARADFNGDGVEDVLVFTAGGAEGGTMGYADYCVLTRMGPSGPLKWIRTNGRIQKTH